MDMPGKQMKFRASGDEGRQTVFIEKSFNRGINRDYIPAGFQVVVNQTMDDGLVFFIGFHDEILCLERILRGPEDIPLITAQGSQKEGWLFFFDQFPGREIDQGNHFLRNVSWQPADQGMGGKATDDDLRDAGFIQNPQVPDKRIRKGVLRVTQKGAGPVRDR